MEVDKQLKFKSYKRMQVKFISNNVDVMRHDCLSGVALALLVPVVLERYFRNIIKDVFKDHIVTSAEERA